MSIGSWRALLKFSENPLVRVVYFVRTPHVQHVTSVALVAIALLSFVVAAGPANAKAKTFPKPDPASGLVNCNLDMGERDDFFDFEYAQKVWFELGTLAALDKERAKYAAVFGPWFERYKVTKDRHGMYEELRNFAGPDQMAMRHGHDLQVAYNTWRCEHHGYWARVYKVADPGDQEPFEAYVKSRSIPFECDNPKKLPTKYGKACGGPLPDWRSEAMKAEDKAMMEAADKVRCNGKPCKKGRKAKGN